MTELTHQEKIKLVEEYMEQAKTDPVVYIDRFCWTFDPRKDNPHLRFRLYPFQKDLVYQLKEGIEQGYDIFIDKSRDMGVTYTILATFLWFWMYISGSNFLVGSRKEDYVDNRFGKITDNEISNKEESLFGKIDYMVRRIQPFMLPQGFDTDKHMGYMKLLNPLNGNVISGESSNPNFSRGSRFKAILLDEFSFWENDQQCWGATADTSPCRIVATTAGIRPSKAKRLRFHKDNEKIKVIEVDFKKDPRKNHFWVAKEKARRSKEDFAREVERNWETSLKGIVYEEIVNAKLSVFDYNIDWPLYISWDFGLDGTAIQWWQKNMENGKKRLVEAYENRDKPIQFYFPFFSLPIDSMFGYDNTDLQLISKLKNFKKAIHFGDPDVAKRAYQDVEKTSTRLALENVGIFINTNLEANNFMTRLNKTKVMLQAGVEVNQTKGTEYWLECMQSARFPERSDNSQATSGLKLPIHDWSSHHRSCTEYLAVNYTEVDIKKIKPQKIYDQEIVNKYYPKFRR